MATALVSEAIAVTVGTTNGAATFTLNAVPPSWYAIKKQDDEEEAEITIYDMIGGWGISADQFIRDIKSIKAKLVNIYINSPGGSVFDGITISNAIKRMKARVVTHVDGIAASIASVVAIAGHEVRMAKNSFMMIHNPMMAGGITADSNELRKMADTLDKMRSQFANTYAEKTKKTPEEMGKLMDEETWFTSDEAKAIGLVDTITGEVKATASVDLSILKNVPEPVMHVWGLKQTNINNQAITAPLESGAAPAIPKEVPAMAETTTQAPPAPAPAAVNTGVTQGEISQDPLREQEIRGYVEQGRAAGKIEGEKATVARFKAILDACPGKPKMAADAFVSMQSPEAVKMAYEATAAAEAAAEARIAQLQTENRRAVALAASGGYSGGVSMGLDSGVDDDEGPMTPELAKESATREWDRNPVVRKGFSSKTNYVSFRSAQLRGQYSGKAVASA